jgi:L-histidine N-alpha-methyltransferase
MKAFAARDEPEPIRRLRAPEDAATSMAAELRQSLSATPLRWIPSKYFYDARGSALFDEITRLPEYYLTRTEETILPGVAAEVARRHAVRDLLELGSGAGNKVRTLVDAFMDTGSLRTVTLLDVSEAALAAALADLAALYPRLEVRGVSGDFVEDLPAVEGDHPRLVAFLGSTIGNLTPEETLRFLGRVRVSLAPGDALLVGLDLEKDVARLEAAYNDARGVTAAFNRNILRVVNDRLGADFDPAAFDHVAFYDADNTWIEMRLRARRRMRVRIRAAGLDLRLRSGEEIRTEISGKYSRVRVEGLLSRARLRLAGWWTDPEALFALALVQRDDDRA